MCKAQCRASGATILLLFNYSILHVKLGVLKEVIVIAISTKYLEVAYPV